MNTDTQLTDINVESFPLNTIEETQNNQNISILNDIEDSTDDSYIPNVITHSNSCMRNCCDSNGKKCGWITAFILFAGLLIVLYLIGRNDNWFSSNSSGGKSGNGTQPLNDTNPNLELTKSPTLYRLNNTNSPFPSPTGSPFPSPTGSPLTLSPTFSIVNISNNSLIYSCHPVNPVNVFNARTTIPSNIDAIFVCNANGQHINPFNMLAEPNVDCQPEVDIFGSGRVIIGGENLGPGTFDVQATVRTENDCQTNLTFNSPDTGMVRYTAQSNQQVHINYTSESNFDLWTVTTCFVNNLLVNITAIGRGFCFWS